MRNAIPNLHITEFAQDGDGYMWIATAKGLCRYNGYEYICYSHDPLDRRSIPSDHITSLFVDSGGCLWVSTEKGLCTYDPYTNSFDRFGYHEDSLRTQLEYQCREIAGEVYVCGVFGVKKADVENCALIPVGGTLGLTVSNVIHDDFSTLWISGLRGDGIWYMERGDTISVKACSEPGLDFFCSYKTPSGELWFGTNRGIRAVNPITKKVTVCDVEAYYPGVAATLSVRFITELDKDRIIIGTENRGAFIYNFVNRQLIPFEETDFVVDINSVHFTSCYVDGKGNTWLGTFDKGYFVELRRDARFNTDKRFNSLFADVFTTRIVEDNEGNFYVGTRYNGLIYYDRDTNTVRKYNLENFGLLRENSSNLIENLFLDSRGNLWIGTLRQLVKCRDENGRITVCQTIDDISPSTITEDSRQNILVGSSMTGLFVIPDGDADRITVVPLANKWNNVTGIVEGKDGRVYFSSYGDGIYVTGPDNFVVEPLAVNDRLHHRQEMIICMYIDSKNVLWAGTYGGGLIRYDTGSGLLTSYTESDGLPDKSVVAITEDYEGNIWMSTSYGLCRLDRATDNIVAFYDDEGIGGNQFHEKCVLRSLNGKIYFGGNHGITYFDSREVTYRDHEIPVVLEDLKVMNISQPIGTPGGILKSHISKQDSVTLTHRHTTFSIDFAGIDFGYSKKIRYAYRLVNFDREWNYTSDYRRATYSNLKPGKYTFEVMAQNFNGTWGDNPTRLAVNVLPSPWLRSEVVVLYIVIALMLLLGGVNLYIKIRMSNENLALARKENEAQKELTSMKIRFFTNISHELRTPLTMIYGPLKKLIQGDTDDKTKDYLLNLLNYNVNNLLRLIDQLMDFARLENDTLTLSVSPTDTAALARNIVNSYNFFAREKNITLDLITEGMEGELFIDSDKFSKILGNLLSNALKYTPDGGHICVEVRLESGQEGSGLVVTVTDDGIGMKEEDLKHLFKRHKRFSSKDDYSKNPGGKGIGLNYVKRLVDIHGGTIRAKLNPAKGMTFSVYLPTGKDHYPENMVDESKYDYADKSLPTETGQEKTGRDADNTQNAERSKPTILVAEDDAELNKFITTLLKDDYKVLSARDGIEGLQLCRTEEITLIISDVLMPRMDGYEFCRSVKEDPELCHLQFIMLTAKILEKDQIEGYDRGADLYITKPFNPDIFERVIRNTFSGIQKRTEHILKGLGTVGEGIYEEIGPEVPGMASMDKRFLEKLYECIDNDITNSNLNINELSSRMAFSRTSFYRKVRALTGLSPNELIKIYRLEKAVKLLDTEEYTISEIVDLTGFGTHSHFSTSFKKHFGVPPKRYKGPK